MAATAETTDYEFWKLLAEWATAFGTIAVAALAIWGDAIRAFFFSPELQASLLHEKGDLTTTLEGRKVRYYHLSISNRRKTVATNCRVLLREIQRRDQSGRFHTVTSYPLPLTWTPAWLGIYTQNVARDVAVDFGFLVDGDDKFQVALLGGVPHNFRGYVAANEQVRFGVELVADNFASKRLHYFDVNWDGKWDDDDDRMRLHLTVAPA